MKKLAGFVLRYFSAGVITCFMVLLSVNAQNPDHRLASTAKNMDSQKDHEVIVNDQQLAQLINSKIQNFVFYGVYDYVTADVSEGSVLLQGWTHEQWIADLLAKELSRIEGIKSIDNQIQQALGSDDLARRAVRAIYSDGLFEKYSFTSNPPIHVVISNNKIILAGTAANEVERTRAASLVDFKTNAVEISNQLQIRQ